VAGSLPQQTKDCKVEHGRDYIETI
jgi:hypothetical protein